ncbi:hypothetical protein PL78_16725 [Yersinia entomophaga]|uniref:Integrase n=1 Tax=Yersinia entomophaga TaxID=935293 RepID=A0ABM6BPF0_YERET|nr:hypothetical protein PL78_16725 [Yersinia entomophaga]OWF90228.1 hypothetical protein B4914_01600 [Yersinia entomophaga]
MAPKTVKQQGNTLSQTTKEALDYTPAKLHQNRHKCIILMHLYIKLTGINELIPKGKVDELG